MLLISLIWLRKCKFCFLCLLLVIPSLYSAPLPQWAKAPKVNELASLTLKESLSYAFGRSPSISQQAAQMGIGDAQIREAQSAWYPQIGLSGNTGSSTQNDIGNSLNNSASYGISLTQLVYDFGKTTNNIRQQEATSESYRYKLMATMTEVAEQTAATYVQVKRYEELVKAARENIASLTSVRDMAKLRADAGLSTRSDVLQAETRIASMRSTQQDYQAQLQTAKSQLAVLTGVQAAHYQSLPDSLAQQPVALDHIDYSQIPTVLMAESQQQAASYAVDKAKSQHWPTISLQGNRTRYENNNNDYWNNQLQLNVQAPVYQGGAVSSRIAQAEGARKMSTSAIDQSKLDVLQKASVAFANWNGARGREEASQQQYLSARNTRDVYKNEYKLSTRSLNDLLSVEQEVFQAEYSRIAANFDGWVAAINYASAVNNLMPLAGIALGDQQRLPELNSN
ncbi:TolC family outer membrane protein [Edaphovirga cremea]|uniref:TolC family outer membrane protein n=1 Tax=Edaphovirga cremea TaxID=2267246 RepID=UPI003989E1BE